MSTPAQEEITSLVSSIFVVKDVRKNLDALQFEVNEEGFKNKFVELVRKLDSKNFVARLERFEGRLFVLVGEFRPPKISRAWIPRLLFAATVSMVMIDGYYKTLAANKITFLGDPINIAILYTISLMGILGIHELGHMIASRWHKLRTSWPYFIPGIPVFGIPTFGAIISARSFMTNKDTLFDVGISGPIAGLIIAIIVSVYGAYTSPLLPSDQVQSTFSKSDLVTIHPSLIMSGTLVLAGKSAEGMQVVMSPVLYAAWLGFLITFLNLLPAWQLDGGHIARATIGKKWHKITTYASVGILAYLGYWFFALWVLAFSMGSRDVRPLDDISPLSRNRKILFVASLALAILSAPHPFSSMH